MDVLGALRDYANGKLGAPPAVAGAIASHFLAVTSSRSFSLVGGDEGVQSLLAHQQWFKPTDIRCTSGSVAAAVGGRQVQLAEALAADIVCIHEPMELHANQLRRGTHVNVLAKVMLGDELEKIATIVREPDLSKLASGHVDGRQLDEITIFISNALTPTR